MGKKFTKKKVRLTLLVILFVFLFFVLYVLSALSGLRFFIPHYFNIAGGPFAEKNYLVLFQNNNELRPTGGFISAYGILKFKNSFFNGIEIQDVFGDVADHEYIKPPYPQAQLLTGPFYQGYTFRDANYDGDFAKSAAELLRMYRLTDTETTFDGILAINMKVLEDVLDILKEVKVGDLVFTSENVFELLEFSLHNIDYHNIEEVKQRKNILGPLSKTIIKKVAFSPLTWRDVSDMVVRNLNEKHIQLHFFDTSLQNKLDKKRWTGTWPKPEGDFLAVVEANLAGMKSDRYIKRDINYRLELWEDIERGGYKLMGNVAITVEHFGDYNVPISGPYSGYFRTYMPKGTVLKDSNVTVYQKSSSDFSIFGTIVKLNPGERQTLVYTIELPQTIFSGTDYHLDLVKQSGTINDSYSIVVEAPQGMIIQSDDFETRENYAIWEDILVRDMSLDFTVLPDELGPRIAYSVLQDLNSVLVVFNERMSAAVLTEPFNITIEDMDVTDPEHHDTITVNSTSIDYRDLRLKISGMTNQQEEFYKLTIKSAYDIHGNAIQPSPKIITLVQRL